MTLYLVTYSNGATAIRTQRRFHRELDGASLGLLAQRGKPVPVDAVALRRPHWDEVLAPIILAAVCAVMLTLG